LSGPAMRLPDNACPTGSCGSSPRARLELAFRPPPGGLQDDASGEEGRSEAPSADRDGLAEPERGVAQKVETGMMRPSLFEGRKPLMVAGNTLLPARGRAFSNWTLPNVVVSTPPIASK